MTKLPFFFFFFLLLLLLLPLIPAEIRTRKFTSIHLPLMMCDHFGFTHTGHITISVSSVSVISRSSSSSTPNPSNLGFFLVTQHSLYQMFHDIRNHSSCILQANYVKPLFTFTSLSPPPVSSYNYSNPIHSPNFYLLFFANCGLHKVSMDVRTELYNTDGGRYGNKDYLSAGITHLPAIYFLFTLVYIVFLGLWINVCVKNKKCVYKIHVLMGTLLMMKMLNLLFAAEDYHYVKVTGTGHGWEVLFYIVEGIRVGLLFTVIVLVGTGWSFLKPFLQEREKKVLMVVIPVQVLVNVGLVISGDTGPFIMNFMMLNKMLLLIDVICCCVIIFPIVWSIRSLRETSKTDGKAARNLSKLTLFRQFYIVVIGFLYFTRIVIFCLRRIADYKYEWVVNATEESASLAFYIFMFYMFKPAEKNEYLIIDDDEEEAAEMALRDDEFEL